MEVKDPTILIVDDVKVNRTIIKTCLQGHGYRFLEADNGETALEQVRSHQVDLVILDLVMPVLDGFGCLTALQADAQHSHIPVIINSSLNDLESVQQALALGCYDYFMKSLPRAELQLTLPLKVKNAIRTKLLLDDVCEKKSMLENEIQAAGKYQRFLLPQDIAAKGIAIRPLYEPCLGVGGDFFDIIPLSGDKTALLIADVSGHGVLAAMVVALLKPLYERYIRDTESPLQTLRHLNRDLLRLTDDTNYITAFVAIYDPSQQTLCYANAGHPPPLYSRRGTSAIEVLKATGVFLGLFAEADWEVHEEIIPVAPHDRLLLVTDGVIDAMSTSGRFFGLEGLCQIFRDMQATDLDTMTRDMWHHLQDFTGDRFEDDVTLVAVDFQELGVSRVISLASDPSLVLPTVDTLLAAIDPACSPHDKRAIKISLVEMLMNAIEHGNLAIGYAHKQAALTDGTFDQLVKARRHTEPYASRLVTVTYTISPTQAVFTIQDEGAGFDWQAVPEPRADAQVMVPHGRGILIARSSMDHCTFHQAGKAVTLVKNLSPPLNGPHVASPGQNDTTLRSIADARKDRIMQIVTTVVDHTTTLTLSGLIDFSSRKTLGALIDDRLAQGCQDFILDLHGVTFVDSSGLGALVACFSTIRKQGGSMKLTQVCGQLLDLIEMTRLTDFFDLCDTVEAAKGSVNL